MAHSGRKARAKVNIPIFLAGVLLCLTLFSIYLSSGVVAKYTTNKADADSARVIRFNNIVLEETGDLVTLDGKRSLVLAPGAALDWDVTVTFPGSESATYVFVELANVGQTKWKSDDNKTFYYFSDKIDSGVIWKVSDEWTPVLGTSGVYHLALDPNDKLTNKAVLAPDGDGKEISVGEEIIAAQLATIETDTLAVDIQASVVQSNGFDSPEEAWESLENKH